MMKKQFIYKLIYLISILKIYHLDKHGRSINYSIYSTKASWINLDKSYRAFRDRYKKYRCLSFEVNHLKSLVNDSLLILQKNSILKLFILIINFNPIPKFEVKLRLSNRNERNVKNLLDLFSKTYYSVREIVPNLIDYELK